MSQPPSPARRLIDLRKHPRLYTPSGALFSFKRLVVPVQFEGTAEGEGTLVDLSLGGCRLLSDTPLEIGELYNLILQVSKESSPVIIEAAAVRWTQANTYGLKFLSVQSVDESHLRDLLLDIRHPSP